MRKLIGLTVLAILAMPTLLSAATYMTWDGGAVTSNWMDGDNWNPNRLPSTLVTGDAVRIGNSNQTATINLNNGETESLVVSTNVTYTAGSNITLNINSGATLAQTGVSSMTIGAATNDRTGVVNVGGALTFGAGPGGASGSTLTINGQGTVNILSGGSMTLAHATRTIGIAQGVGGTIAVAGTLNLGRGAARAGNDDFRPAGDLIMKGGTIQETGTGDYGWQLYMSAGTGVMKGYGTVNLSSFNLYGGKLIANGNPDGAANADRILDLTNTTNNSANSSTLTSGNAAGNGFYATNRGILAWKAVNLNASQQIVFGAGATSALVGQGAFTLGAGTVDNGSGVGINLVASDVSTLPGILTNAVGIWQVRSNDLTVDSVVGSVFYYDLLAAEAGGFESDLKLFAYNGSAWIDATNELDTTGNKVTGTSSDSLYQYYAVATSATAVPEPATMALLVLGGLGVLARRRNRR